MPLNCLYCVKMESSYDNSCYFKKGDGNWIPLCDLYSKLSWNNDEKSILPDERITKSESTVNLDPCSSSDSKNIITKSGKPMSLKQLYIVMRNKKYSGLEYENTKK